MRIDYLRLDSINRTRDKSTGKMEREIPKRCHFGSEAKESFQQLKRKALRSYLKENMFVFPLLSFFIRPFLTRISSCFLVHDSE